MNLTDKGIKVIVEVDGNIITSPLMSKENKRENSYWLILLLAIITTFVIFPESKDTLKTYINQHQN